MKERWKERRKESEKESKETGRSRELIEGMTESGKERRGKEKRKGKREKKEKRKDKARKENLRLISVPRGRIGPPAARSRAERSAATGLGAGLRVSMRGCGSRCGAAGPGAELTLEAVPEEAVAQHPGVEVERVAMLRSEEGVRVRERRCSELMRSDG